MAKARKLLHAADLFCGGGGTTTGAEQSGFVKVNTAVNHWSVAIDTHRHNHPNTLHICQPIETINARHDSRIAPVDLLMASPECTHHSIAHGGQPVEDQKRATPWNVAGWAEAKRPKAIVVENVREFRDWGPLRQKRDKQTNKLLWRPDGRPWLEPDPKHKGETFRAWIQAIESLGYVVDHQLLNAADFGAATSRTRMFLTAIRRDIYRRRRLREIPWPETTHSGHWKPAYEIIDWSKPCPSIFTRKRPLVDKTLRRIEIGLRKQVEPFIVTLRRNMADRSIADPLATITAGAEHHALAIPFQYKALGRSPGLTRGIDEPVPTIVAARANHAIAVPFFLPRQGRYDCYRDKPTRSIQDPLNTITASHGPGHVVVPYLLACNHGGDDDRSRSIGDPMATLTTKTGHSLVVPFLTKYYGTGGVAAIDEPLDTITTHHRFGLAMVSLIRTMHELGIADIGFRMLDDDELARATGFPEDYHFCGNKAERVKQIGNAVPPAFARAICTTLAEAV